PRALVEEFRELAGRGTVDQVVDILLGALIETLSRQPISERGIDPPQAGDAQGGAATLECSYGPVATALRPEILDRAPDQFVGLIGEQFRVVPEDLPGQQGTRGAERPDERRELVE